MATAAAASGLPCSHARRSNFEGGQTCGKRAVKRGEGEWSNLASDRGQTSSMGVMWTSVQRSTLQASSC
eukprot:2401901-Rhodomonas_salina.1